MIYFWIWNDLRQNSGTIPENFNPRVTAMRLDMVFYTECERIVYFIELPIPSEDVTEEVFEWKKLKYVN